LYYPEPIARLIDSFSRLPGIGPKTAARLAFHVLRMKEEEAVDFAKALVSVKRNLFYCSICCNITDTDPCRICADKTRDPSVICAVQEPKDVVAMERTKEFGGLYHVLHGAISPLDGIGPDDIRIAELVRRLSDERDQSEHRRRSDRHVFVSAGQAVRHQGDPNRSRVAGRRRFGIRRRSDAVQSFGRTARTELN
jgi:recombination protein RecR